MACITWASRVRPMPLNPLIPRPLRLTSMPDSILSKILGLVMEYHDPSSKAGERYPLIYNEMIPYLNYLLRPITGVDARLTRLALEAFLDNNVFQVECVPNLHIVSENPLVMRADPFETWLADQERLSYASKQKLNNIKHVNLRVALSGSGHSHAFEPAETSAHVEFIKDAVPKLAAILTRLESLSIWFDAKTRDGGKFLCDKEFHEVLSPQQQGTARAVQQVFATFQHLPLPPFALAFDELDNVKPWVDVRGKSRLETLMELMQDANKEKIIWVDLRFMD